ncbi:hypothetical protein AALO_G00024110 [Alosa alosa]|uniref:Uncharacterized protein n=1 Tax=Alosa alosa TaxID=278164 RepID=A0AAV6HA84_9TELE|nr:hypothetical protein AALO_G00024110 [Alosa alosa]
MGRPKLMRWRRPPRLSLSQRRRNRRQSSTTPTHPSIHLSIRPFRPLLQQPPVTPGSPFPLSYFFSSPPSPEKYFYQQFCKYWYRFLAQNKAKCVQPQSYQVSPLPAKGWCEFV